MSTLNVAQIFPLRGRPIYLGDLILDHWDVCAYNKKILYCFVSGQFKKNETKQNNDQNVVKNQTAALHLVLFVKKKPQKLGKRMMS